MEQVGLLRFDFLESRTPVVAAFSTRQGGVSDWPFATLNLGLHTGDEAVKVLTNRERVAGALKIPLERWVIGEQVHSNGVAVVGYPEAGRGAIARESSLPGVDALVTREKGLALAGFFADCVPVYIVDPVRCVIGLAHAGWRSTRLKVVVRTIETMQSFFATSPADCFALLGPAIGPCCYEVGPEVAGKFPPNCSVPKEGRWFLDLWEANRRILLQAGLKNDHIFVTGSCTCCQEELFYSYRRDGEQTGRMGAFLCLIP